MGTIRSLEYGYLFRLLHDDSSNPAVIMSPHVALCSGESVETNRGQIAWTVFLAPDRDMQTIHVQGGKVEPWWIAEGGEEVEFTDQSCINGIRSAFRVINSIQGEDGNAPFVTVVLERSIEAFQQCSPSESTFAVLNHTNGSAIAMPIAKYWHDQELQRLRRNGFYAARCVEAIDAGQAIWKASRLDQREAMRFAAELLSNFMTGKSSYGDSYSLSQVAEIESLHQAIADANEQSPLLGMVKLYQPDDAMWDWVDKNDWNEPRYRADRMADGWREWKDPIEPKSKAEQLDLFAENTPAIGDKSENLI